MTRHSNITQWMVEITFNQGRAFFVIVATSPYCEWLFFGEGYGNIQFLKMAKLVELQ